VCTSLTCAATMSAASGVPYRHLFSALAAELRHAPPPSHG